MAYHRLSMPRLVQGQLAICALLLSSCTSPVSEPPPREPVAEPSARSALAPIAPPEIAPVPTASASAAAATASTVHATPIDGEVRTPTKAELAAALKDSVVTKGGTKTVKGVVIASDCVTPARNAAARQGRLSDDMPIDQRFDLDGDGVEDRLLGGAAGMTLTVDLYVMRGDCGHHVGQAKYSGGLKETPDFAGGMRVLSATGGCPIDCCKDEVTYELRFEGGSYRAHKKARTRDCSRRAP